MFFAQMAGAICGCFITPACFTIVNMAYEIPSEDGALPAPPASTSFSVGSCNTPLAYAPPRHLQGIYGPIYRVLAIITTTGGGEISLGAMEVWHAGSRSCGVDNLLGAW